MRRFTFLIVFLLLINVLNAETSYVKFEYDMPGLVGIHSHIDMPFKIPLDLKMAPIKINRVVLYLEGKSSPGSAISTKDDSRIELPAQFDIAIADHFAQYSFGPETLTASFESLPSNFKSHVIFKPRLGNYSADWNFLNKGSGELLFTWGRGCQVSCRYIEHSTVNITKAVLIIEGDGSYIENDKSADRTSSENINSRQLTREQTKLLAAKIMENTPERSYYYEDTKFTWVVITDYFGKRAPKDLQDEVVKELQKKYTVYLQINDIPDNLIKKYGGAPRYINGFSFSFWTEFEPDEVVKVYCRDWESEFSGNSYWTRYRWTGTDWIIIGQDTPSVKKQYFLNKYKNQIDQIRVFPYLEIKGHVKPKVTQ